MLKNILTLIGDHPTLSFIMLFGIVYIIVMISVSISRNGLLQQYELHHVPAGLDQPTLTVRWTGSPRFYINWTDHRNFFMLSLVNAKYGSGAFNKEVFDQLMELNGYTNISITECKEKTPGS